MPLLLLALLGIVIGIALLVALVLGSGLGLIFLIWELYRLVIPYFFGSFVPTVHSPGYSLVYPHFWPFVGLWILLTILLSMLGGIRLISCKPQTDS